MVMERFLKNNRRHGLTQEERKALEGAVSEIKTLAPRKTIVRARETLHQSIFLVDGTMSRYIDDTNGVRQFVSIHFAGDFVDLHAYPLGVIDHDVATTTEATVAIIPHTSLGAIIRDLPEIGPKLWFATLVDAAIHRAWLFRLGRLDAVGRVAHFLCETNARLMSAGLSDGHRFALGLRQTDLAEICGLTTVHVNRVMRRLREDGLCEFRSSWVHIPDPARLAAIGQFDPQYLYFVEDAGVEQSACPWG